MNSWFKKLERTFAAVPFAEMDEHKTAMEMAGLKPRARKKEALSWDNTFAAVAFAEAGCYDVAKGLMGKDKMVRRSAQTLDAFLDNVGLMGVRVSYGVVGV